MQKIVSRMWYSGTYLLLFTIPKTIDTCENVAKFRFTIRNVKLQHENSFVFYNGILYYIDYPRNIKCTLQETDTAYMIYVPNPPETGQEYEIDWEYVEASYNGRCIPDCNTWVDDMDGTAIASLHSNSPIIIAPIVEDGVTIKAQNYIRAISGTIKCNISLDIVAGNINDWDRLLTGLPARSGDQPDALFYHAQLKYKDGTFGSCRLQVSTNGDLLIIEAPESDCSLIAYLEYEVY